MLTERKAIDQHRAQAANKRGGAKVRGESVFDNQVAASGAARFDAFADVYPTPESAVQMTEEFRLLFEKLNDDDLQKVALRKMEGYTNREIADEIDMCVSSVERKLALIRKIWLNPDD